VLTGSTIALTELYERDSEALFAWINDPQTVRHNAPYAPVHEPNHKLWFESLARDQSRIVFGIREIASDRIIGVVQLVNIHPVHRSAELIIRIGAEADRGRGNGLEALRLAIRFAFDDRNLQRIWLRVFADNSRAVRAYEKAGLQHEGIMRRSVYLEGRWQDEVIMAILNDG
jgi:RimJ/RimL family protein N-acetyltransferase